MSSISCTTSAMRSAKKLKSKGTRWEYFWEIRLVSVSYLKSQLSRAAHFYGRSTDAVLAGSLWFFSSEFLRSISLKWKAQSISPLSTARFFFWPICTLDSHGQNRWSIKYPKWPSSVFFAIFSVSLAFPVCFFFKWTSDLDGFATSGGPWQRIIRECVVSMEEVFQVQIREVHNEVFIGILFGMGSRLRITMATG